MDLPQTPSPGLHYHYPLPAGFRSENVEAEVVVYGGSACGVAAAVQGARMGLRTVLLVFGRHVGGMTSGGLGATDLFNPDTIGGIADEFYRRLGRHYGEARSLHFEPHVAERTFLEMLAEAGVRVFYEQRPVRVHKDGATLHQLDTEGGGSFRARIFVDADYNGDLMALAGVTHVVGRESNAVYGETLNGVHFGHPNHNFERAVDPYLVPGKPGSGLLPGIMDEAPRAQGDGDRCVQAFNFRMCFTTDPVHRRPLPKPARYDPARYELLRRYIEAGVWDALKLTVRMPNRKTDTNNFGGFSSDHVGGNHAWPRASYAERERIFQEHVEYQQGLYYFLATDPRLPTRVRDDMNRFGLPTDEFPETGGWPHELYVRESRRMVGELVMTEHHCRSRVTERDAIAIADVQMDSHNCRRLAMDGRAVNEGNVEVPVPAPYPVSYRAILPRRSECTNLLVPWCLSTSHIAFGSIRMEPVGMVLGQSAATAAAMALRHRCAVQDVDYGLLRARLLADGQRLERVPKPAAQTAPSIKGADDPKIIPSAPPPPSHQFAEIGTSKEDVTR